MINRFDIDQQAFVREFPDADMVDAALAFWVKKIVRNSDTPIMEIDGRKWFGFRWSEVRDEVPLAKLGNMRSVRTHVDRLVTLGFINIAPFDTRMDRPYLAPTGKLDEVIHIY